MDGLYIGAIRQTKHEKPAGARPPTGFSMQYRDYIKESAICYRVGIRCKCGSRGTGSKFIPELNRAESAVAEILIIHKVLQYGFDIDGAGWLLACADERINIVGAVAPNIQFPCISAHGNAGNFGHMVSTGIIIVGNGAHRAIVVFSQHDFMGGPSAPNIISSLKTDVAGRNVDVKGAFAGTKGVDVCPDSFRTVRICFDTRCSRMFSNHFPVAVGIHIQRLGTRTRTPNIIVEHIGPRSDCTPLI